MKEMNLDLAMEQWRNCIDNIDDLTTMLDELVGHNYATMTLIFEYGKQCAEAATAVQRAGFQNDTQMLGAWMQAQESAGADKEKD